MDESEWLKSEDPLRMLACLDPGNTIAACCPAVFPSDRELLLFVDAAKCEKCAGLLEDFWGPARQAEYVAGASCSSRVVKSALLREILGNPYRPVTLSLLDRSRIVGWEGGIIRRVAQAAYEDADFDRLGVLADALEEAGCTDDAILTHLRSAGPHVRGCWALDLILGNE